MEIIGYKCFNENMTNRYGIKFEEGITYIANGEISFGNDGNGFHFCKNLEDTFRYFPANEENVSVCKVKATGKIVSYEDDYNGYYDMYSAEKMEIIKKLSREEVILYGLNLNSIRVCRFIQGYKLTDSEIELFKEKFNNYTNVLKYIDYYQLNDKDAFKII